MSVPARLETPPPFSVGQLADRWGCSEGLVRKLIRNGDLQCFRPGALIRISVEEVERYECQNHSQSRNLARASQSSGGKTAETARNVVVSDSPRQIGPAPKRKPASAGKGATIHHGPWGDA